MNLFSWKSGTMLILHHRYVLWWVSHYGDVVMGTVASQITSLTIVYSTVYSGADQRKHQSSASLALVRGIHRGPVNSPHKWPVTRKMFPFDDIIMNQGISSHAIELFLPEYSGPSTRLVKFFIFIFYSFNVDTSTLSLRVATSLHIRVSYWYFPFHLHHLDGIYYIPRNTHQGSLLITWINFNHSMDK